MRFNTLFVVALLLPVLALGGVSKRDLARAKSLGLDLKGKPKPVELNVAMSPSMFPLLMVVRMDKEASHRGQPAAGHRLYYRKDGVAPLLPALDYADNIRIVYSVSGKNVLLISTAKDRTSHIVLPLSAFDAVYAKPRAKDSVVGGLRFHGVDLTALQDVSSTVAAGMPEASHCSSLNVTSDLWADDEHLNVAIEGKSCGNDTQKEDRRWTALLEIKTQKLQKLSGAK